ncbi:uncharacterized protein LOC110038368 [Phalaenopsis equestris]|uniref:uncharacterized protein LOC110038368 n=1 Tax=Phalaenopsis equestris TaxID=78828 RepID=UPI0009E58DC6|nr:uncharacterized protein LOC110038368 [Phalaenopsis equestris]
MDLDLALRMENPAPLTDASSSEDRRIYEKWDRSNRLSLMIIKRGIPEAFRGAVSSEITDAASFLAEIEKRFAKSDKTETGILLKKLISMRFRGKKSIREYIVEMSNIASKLKLLKLELPDDLLVHLVLSSHPPQFGQFLDFTPVIDQIVNPKQDIVNQPLEEQIQQPQEQDQEQML